VRKFAPTKGAAHGHAAETPGLSVWNRGAVSGEDRRRHGAWRGAARGNSAAKEWAPVATPAGFRTNSGKISDGTMTYYDGTTSHPNNSANKANLEATRALRTFLIGMARQEGKSR
jgi:hypothetical protein